MYNPSPWNTLQSVHIERFQRERFLHVADEGGGISSEGGGSFAREIGAGGVTRSLITTDGGRVQRTAQRRAVATETQRGGGKSRAGLRRKVKERK